MARLIYSEQALAAPKCLADFLIESDRAAVTETVDLIAEATEVLANHPLIGRAAEHGLRALLISRGRSGYVALYSYERCEEAVLILAIRHQSEAGYFGE
ncbi:MAG: type II toxin-antitoxin system RelE/ParE family toxin [Gammaproteobacteria bacterium]|nr:type II toxin-antitoxin system RelE/ParE family toxin [Gammaproteobacteria bacterium]MCP5138091.1 type II toxin-antitoxin system RelE/ParE family toxin [Gammaproteobacteria bacterium]